MVYTLRANSIYLSGKWYIPFEQIVYTFRAKGIYLTTARYIPHDSEVYSSRQQGIYLTTARYIPHDGKVYSSRRRGIFLTKRPDFTLSASDLTQSAAPPLTDLVSGGAAGGFPRRE